MPPLSPISHEDFPNIAEDCFGGTNASKALIATDWSADFFRRNQDGVGRRGCARFVYFPFFVLFQTFLEYRRLRQVIMLMGFKQTVLFRVLAWRCCRVWSGVYVWQKPFLGQQILDTR